MTWKIKSETEREKSQERRNENWSVWKINSRFPAREEVTQICIMYTPMR